MKILHVQQTLAPNHGGPTTVLLNLAKSQCIAGHEIVIATTNQDQPRGTYCDPGWFKDDASGIAVFYSPVQIPPLVFSRELTAYLTRAVAKFDIVHIHGLYRFPSTYAAFQARRQGVPYIIRPHGSLDPFLYNKSSAGSLIFKRLYERWFDLPNLHAADAIHYTAEEERDRASFLGLRSPSFIVPNGLDWSGYESLPARGVLRARWGLGDKPMVLFLGRLHLKKGLDLLVPAFDKLRHLVPEVQLVIAGPENDSYGQQVRNWVEERGLNDSVRFVGPLYGDDVLQAYIDADVFALPSYTENFGMTVIEAMACNLPVVISDQVNIHAEVAEAGAGLITRCDIDEVAQALETVLNDDQMQAMMGRAGRQLVRERYTWSAIVDSLTKEYETVIAKKNA